MKLGILHFTDSHIKSATDWILSEFSSLVASVKTIYEECDRIYIVFTGDVVYSGSEEEYILASKFLNSIRSLLKTLYKDKVYEQIIFTPGNHDCNFNMDRQARKNAIKNMNYDYIGDDNSVIEQCLIVQEPFWNFENSINGKETKPCIYKEYIDDIQKEVVIFHSFNTAWMSSFIEVRDKLLGSGLLVYDEDEWFHFGYNYIFYFLIAQKIATILTEEKGRQIIQYLCKNIQVDKYANILIFVAHHSKDPFLIDETILASMIPFDDIEPITLERNGSFNELIKDIIQEFKDDIIRSNTDPIQEREKSLESRDKLELQMKDNTYEEDYQNMPSEIISFYQAVRSLEIVGQIIKNRKGSISKQKLHEMIKELYLTAFRTIGFLGKIIKSTKEELTISIQSKVEKDDSKSEIAERINLFFQLMSFNFCLGIFSKVINSVGNRDLKPIFDDVANELNTPAAKLISFSIKTCYGKLSIPELKLLYKEFENNPVALRILKARVKSYLYNNYVKYDERQRIASTLKMSLIQPRGNNLISRT